MITATQQFEFWVWHLTECCQRCEARPGWWGGVLTAQNFMTTKDIAAVVMIAAKAVPKGGNMDTPTVCAKCAREIKEGEGRYIFANDKIECVDCYGGLVSQQITEQADAIRKSNMDYALKRKPDYEYT